MPIDATAADLRRRADELRRYADHLDATPVDAMLRWAGADTWTSPRAAELLDELGVDRSRLLAASDDLRRAAHALDAHASVVEEQTRQAALSAIAALVR